MRDKLGRSAMRKTDITTNDRMGHSEKGCDDCIKVLVADDHLVVRDGLKLILEGDGRMKVVGEASDGKTAIDLAIQLRPDVVIMDISLPGISGIDATSVICATCPSIHVIMLSMLATMDYVHAAIEAGARGYVLKESAGKEVVQAVHAVCRGHRHFSQKIAESMADDFMGRKHISRETNRFDLLSVREKEVLRMVVSGKTTENIAQLLNLSPKTVGTYRSRIMHKLGVSRVADLVRSALTQAPHLFR
jgi:DNA-binding NarL/FixJ family response regulator